MYFNIFRRDMKRNKTMNIILLLFTILASMFVSSGLSNVITVMNGTDFFFDKAGVGDLTVVTSNGDGGIEDILNKSANVKSFKEEKLYYVSNDTVLHDGAKLVLPNTVLLEALQKDTFNFFTADNEIMDRIEDGEVYFTTGVMKNNDLKIGDEVVINFSGIEKSFRFAGEVKDAMFGAEMLANCRMLISEKDFGLYEEDESMEVYSGWLYSIFSDDVQALNAELADAENIISIVTRGMLKLSYVMDMIVAMIVFIVSVCLVLISFVLLKFVISMTIAEEYREIGVMKAIGICNLKIRSIYLVKYFMMAVVGGIIGFIAGIPFADLLMKSVSEKMYLGSESGLLMNILGSFAVIIVMIGFAYLSTKVVKKATPVDAIRNGQTGERFRKKSVYSMKKAHTKKGVYLAINDILSSPKKFIVVIFAFFLCFIMVFGVSMVRDTMKSDRLIGTLGKKSDVYITDSKLFDMKMLSTEGDGLLLDKCREIESDISEMGIPGKVCAEVWYQYSISSGDITLPITVQQNKDTDTTDYQYLNGTAPRNSNEIAITPLIAEKLKAGIGDVVTIDYGTEKRQCMVTAIFQTMNQLGEVIRIHQDAPTSMDYARALTSYQIDFNDTPGEAEITERINRIKDFYGITDIFNCAEFVTDCIGVAGTMDTVADMLLVITCIVVILVTVLMERSFIQGEKGQIALLKAVGFKNGFIIRWHTLRFLIVTVFAEILAALLTYPVTKLWCDPIWRTMGATEVNYYFKPVMLLGIYPGIILGVNFLAVLLTSLVTRKINSRDIVNIE